MSLAAFNRRRRELAAKQKQNKAMKKVDIKHTKEGGQKKNGKVRKTKADPGN